MKTKQVKKEQSRCVCCSRRQKILGIVALGGLFACGLMVGMAINVDKAKRHDAPVAVVSALAEKIQESVAADQKAQETCELLEEMLQGLLIEENVLDVSLHMDNISIYEKLLKYGCPENADKYESLIARENYIIQALNGNGKQTCQEIEDLLSQSMPWGGASSDDRITRAKIYANLSERGCPENSAKYVELAKQELQIARALRDDDFSESDTIEVVETYKRLHMQAAAEEILDKVKKITNPAIDFILQVEKIIKE